MAENFEQISSFKVLDAIQVEKYRSKRTGINFCFAKVPGPLVNGFLCLGKLRAAIIILLLSCEFLPILGFIRLANLKIFPFRKRKETILEIKPQALNCLK